MRKRDHMCLAIPAKIARLDGGGLATVDILGVTRSISIDLTPQVQQGDFVLVHAGFAIEVVDAEYAQETIDLIRQFPDLAGEDLGSLEQSGSAVAQADDAFALTDVAPVGAGA